MKWSFIILLPAIISIGWAIATLALKKHPSRAQIILSTMMLIEGASMCVLAVFFRGRAGSLFIYNYLFETLAVMCGPLYYIGICSLTGPRGVTLKQRRVFIIPLLFILGLTAAAFKAGPLRYERFCYAMRDLPFSAAFGTGHSQMFLAIWSTFIFTFLLIVVNAAILMRTAHKLDVFCNRYNAFYADETNLPKLDIRAVKLLVWIFLPIAIGISYAASLRPLYYKYIIIVLALIITYVQWRIGQFVFSLDHDARYLARHVSHNKTTSA